MLLFGSWERKVLNLPEKRQTSFWGATVTKTASIARKKKMYIQKHSCNSTDIFQFRNFVQHRRANLLVERNSMYSDISATF